MTGVYVVNVQTQGCDSRYVIYIRAESLNSLLLLYRGEIIYMGKIMNLDRINPIKRDIVADILSKVDGYPYLKKMVIFGSSIRNDCRKDSDIDIALEWTEDCLDEDYLYKPFVNPVRDTISTKTKGNNDVVNIGYEGNVLKEAIINGVTVYER